LSGLERDRVTRTYDAVAHEYATAFGDDIHPLPFDVRLSMFAHRFNNLRAQSIRTG
jgi:hypothetical protein